MPQSNVNLTGGSVETNIAGAPEAQYQTRGGAKTALNLTAASAIKVGKGRLARLSVLSGGTTSGAFTLNDSATLAGAVAGNIIYNAPFGLAAGTVIDIDEPFFNGLVLSAVPGAGAPVIAVSYR